jgi:dihydropyrimidinase
MTSEPVDLVIRSGTVVTDSWQGPANVHVSNGMITQLTTDDSLSAAASAREVDASGKLVMPGGVDPHCHIGLPLGPYTTMDDYRSATLAALWGGTTTVIDFAIPAPGQSPADALAERRDMARDARCDYALHGCVTAWDSTTEDQLRAMAADGVRTIKLFTTYRNLLRVDDQTVGLVMATLRTLHGIVYVHAEADHLIENAQQRCAASGAIDASHHAATRPELAEEAAVSAVLATALAHETPVYFVHLSTPAAVDLVRAARRRGALAFSETCPHYLILDDQRYQGTTPERFVCCPPLRGRGTADELTDMLLRDFVDTVGSDHCCYDTTQKTEHAGDVRAMPNGMPGVETRLPVMFSELVHRRGLPLSRFVALTSSNPARLNGIFPRKGTIAPGSDADLVVLDASLTRVIDARDLHMATDYSPYEGMEVTGWPGTVIANGQVVIENGELVSDPGPVGTFLPAAPFPR